MKCLPFVIAGLALVLANGTIAAEAKTTTTQQQQSGNRYAPPPPPPVPDRHKETIDISSWSLPG